MRQGANLVCLFDARHMMKTGAGAASNAKALLDVMNTYPSKRMQCFYLLKCVQPSSWGDWHQSDVAVLVLSCAAGEGFTIVQFDM